MSPEKAGLLDTGRSDRDRRVRVVRLTEVGWSRLAGALPLWKAAHGRIVAALGDETANALHAALDSASLAMAHADPETREARSGINSDDQIDRG